MGALYGGLQVTFAMLLCCLSGVEHFVAVVYRSWGHGCIRPLSERAWVEACLKAPTFLYKTFLAIEFVCDRTEPPQPALTCMFVCSTCSAKASFATRMKCDWTGERLWVLGISMSIRLSFAVELEAATESFSNWALIARAGGGEVSRSAKL